MAERIHVRALEEMMKDPIQSATLSHPHGGPKFHLIKTPTGDGYVGFFFDAPGERSRIMQVMRDHGVTPDQEFSTIHHFYAWMYHQGFEIPLGGYLFIKGFAEHCADSRKRLHLVFLYGASPDVKEVDFLNETLAGHLDGCFTYEVADANSPKPESFYRLPQESD